jgi:ketosteroid isomerase-like protein
MPPDSNLEIVRKFVEAFNRLDLDALSADIAPDAELHEWPTGVGVRSYRGPDGIREALAEWFDVWEWMKVEITNIEEKDDRILATFHHRAKGRASEVEVEIDSYNVYRFRDGQITSIELFTEREPALRAAGLTSEAGQKRMSHENSRLVRRVMEAYNRDPTSVPELLAADVELIEWPESPDQRTYRGRDGALAAFESWSEAWESVNVDIDELVEAGEHVLARGRTHGKGKGSSVEVSMDAFNVYTIREGEVARIQFFTTEEPALRAAGLTESVSEAEEAE